MAKCKGQKLKSKGLFNTFDGGRRTEGTPLTVEQRGAIKPPRTTEKKVQHVTVAIRAPHDSPEKVDSFNALEAQPLQHTVLAILLVVIPKGEKLINSQLDVARGVGAPQFLFATDRGFSPLKMCL